MRPFLALLIGLLLALAPAPPAHAACFTPGPGDSDTWRWRDDGSVCGVWTRAPDGQPPAPELPPPDLTVRAWLPVVCR